LLTNDPFEATLEVTGLVDGVGLAKLVVGGHVLDDEEASDADPGGKQLSWETGSILVRGEYPLGDRAQCIWQELLQGLGEGLSNGSSKSDAQVDVNGLPLLLTAISRIPEGL